MHVETKSLNTPTFIYLTDYIQALREIIPFTIR